MILRYVVGKNSTAGGAYGGGGYHPAAAGPAV